LPFSFSFDFFVITKEVEELEELEEVEELE
jgi:hypothetical protein